jgi:HlyD family secretion protein
MQVRTLVSETDLGKIRPGRARASPWKRSRPAVPRHGHEDRAAGVVEQNVTMFPVLVHLDNMDGAAQAGHERRGHRRDRAPRQRRDHPERRRRPCATPWPPARCSAWRGPDAYRAARRRAARRGAAARRAMARAGTANRHGSAECAAARAWAQPVPARRAQRARRPRMPARGRRGGAGSAARRRARRMPGRGVPWRGGYGPPNGQRGRATRRRLRPDRPPASSRVPCAGCQRLGPHGGHPRRRDGEQVVLISVARLQQQQQDMLNRMRERNSGPFPGGGRAAPGRARRRRACSSARSSAWRSAPSRPTRCARS